MSKYSRRLPSSQVRRACRCLSGIRNQGSIPSAVRTVSAAIQTGTTMPKSAVLNHVMLCRAVAGGMDANNAVVVIADCNDPMGFELAAAAAERAGMHLQDESRRVESIGEIPTAIVVVPLSAARALFTPTHPSVAAGLNRQPPLGCVRVVSIASGAATLVHCDIRPTTPIARA